MRSSGGGWRDYLTLLHLPYTAWHLSYVVVGGCLAAEVAWGRLGLTVLAFFLAMGIGAHALDELAGQAARHRDPVVRSRGAGADLDRRGCAIGLAVAVGFSLWILPLVAIGAFLVPAYNLELFGGRFHSDVWFAVAWGAFPVITGYVAVEGTPRIVAFVAAGWATALSLAQRQLSTPVRRARREVVSVEGEIGLASGDREPITRELLVSAPEDALRLLTIATVLIAAALVAIRL